MSERTEAQRQSDIRRDNAAWMNEQLAERLPDADYQQPGVAPAKDARPDNEFPVQGGKTTPRRVKATDTP